MLQFIETTSQSGARQSGRVKSLRGLQFCNFIDVEQDSEPEYGVLQLESAVMINSVETLKSSGGQTRSLSIQLRSGYSFFYSTVDTGSPVSFLNKRTCDLLLQERIDRVSRYHPVPYQHFVCLL